MSKILGGPIGLEDAMTGQTGKHRTNQPADPSESLERAEKALKDAKQERIAAEARGTFLERLMEGWSRVHDRNHLAELFTEEYRRTR